MPDSLGITLTVGGLGAMLLGLFMILGTAGLPEAYASQFPGPARVGATLAAIGSVATVAAGVFW